MDYKGEDYIAAMLGCDYKDVVKRYNEDPLVYALIKALKYKVEENIRLSILLTEEESPLNNGNEKKD